MRSGTRMVPHCMASVAPASRTSGKPKVSTSVKGAVSGVTSNRICSGVESGCRVWNIRARGSNTTVQVSGRTTIHTEYFPLARAWPFTNTSLPTSSVVAQLAPGVQTSSHFTSPPNSASRPRARGREYSTEITVPSIVWLTEAGSLALTWPATGGRARAQSSSPVAA